MNEQTIFEDDALSANHQQTEQALHKLNHLLSDCWRHLSPDAVSQNEHAYLHALYDDPLNLTELARRVGVKLPSASAMVGKLEQRQLIGRISNRRDRRSVELQLTPEAYEQLQLGRQVYQSLLAALQQRMPPDEYATFTAQLVSVSRYL